MAKFIKFLNGASAGKVVEYVNVDQVATAKYFVDSVILQITVVGNPEPIELQGDDAVAAMKLLDKFA